MAITLTVLAFAIPIYISVKAWRKRNVAKRNEESEINKFLKSRDLTEKFYDN